MEISLRRENSIIMDIVTVDHFLCCLKVKKSSNFCHKIKGLFLAWDWCIFDWNSKHSWKYNNISIPCGWFVSDNLQFQWVCWHFQKACRWLSTNWAVYEIGSSWEKYERLWWWKFMIIFLSSNGELGNVPRFPCGSLPLYFNSINPWNKKCKL